MGYPESIGVGLAEEDWSGDAQFLEYSSAVDPIASGDTSKIPVVRFSPSIYALDKSYEHNLDLSAELGVGYSATSPGLLASFVRIMSGETLVCNTVSTSELYYVLSGSGVTKTHFEEEVHWTSGTSSSCLQTQLRNTARPRVRRFITLLMHHYSLTSA